MSRKFARVAIVSFALFGAASPAVLADILVVTIGKDTGKILDTELVPDGKTEITVKPIFVPGM